MDSVPILKTAEELAEIRDKVRCDKWRYTVAGVDVTREVPIAFHVGDATVPAVALRDIADRFGVPDFFASAESSVVVRRGAKDTTPDEPTAIIGG